MDASTPPPESNVTSPEQRPSSPTLSVSPSIALDAVPRLDRAASTPTSSSVSTASARSRHKRMSDGAATMVKRRGYMRPQGTAFADSARNRDSVMSLGSIAHMQYYFARTGLLDGKGAQLAKERETKRKPSNNGKENLEPSGADLDDWGVSSLCLNDTNAAYAGSELGPVDGSPESPCDVSDAGDPWSSGEAPMLPPTVSTYKQRPSYTEPLPEMSVLRRELKEALQDACKVLEETQKSSSEDQHEEVGDGFYELQGLHLLDIITLAIRAAKNYYTAHTNPQKLYDIRSEKMIRSDLYKALDVLKRMASRNFRGGIRTSELTDIILWIESIDKLLKKEEQREEEETAERAQWIWRDGDWSGRERQREWLFLRSFDQQQPPLPQWPELSSNASFPSDFLKALQDGQRLVKLHNALVSRSKRNFGEIKTWHEDVGKPYRMAENLRFWIKASELRWEIKLSVPVLDVVNGKGEMAWRAVDEAIFNWSRGVRTELTEEWRLEEESEKRKAPQVNVRGPNERNEGLGESGDCLQSGA
ncbi:hypothetical protein BDY17DRAFT_288612 [Neohortaea acidophila]|uniref:Uncharacterized protein n=1 Tax=Neohortaea acidophila TaxID=245834 RepID=A0A6A6Q5M7_9PEZI|nr:uncharacterized protein BDY17DRAFT_288612 [Neohortaea acidophila]KAF2487256.1 hypothetical protein BDY17DRAFT_288612 [Neohortaea acidophila]